jgi:hypothetical protein
MSQALPSMRFVVEGYRPGRARASLGANRRAKAVTALSRRGYSFRLYSRTDPC